MAGETYYVLNEEDRALLLEMKRFMQQQRKSGRTRSLEDQTTPPSRTFIALSPLGGIPGLTEQYEPGNTGTGSGTGDAGPTDVAGNARCEIYRLVQMPDEVGHYLLSLGKTEIVHNISPCVIPGQRWIPVSQESSGQWIALYRDCDVPPVLNPDPGTGTGTADDFVVLPCCEGTTIPTILCVSFSSGTNGCECLDGVSLNFVYDGLGAWVYSSGQCAALNGGPGPTAQMRLVPVCVEGEDKIRWTLYTTDLNGQVYATCGPLGSNTTETGCGLLAATFVLINAQIYYCSDSTLEEGNPCGTANVVVIPGSCGVAPTGTGTGGSSTIDCDNGNPSTLVVTLIDDGGCGCLEGQYSVAWNGDYWSITQLVCSTSATVTIACSPPNITVAVNCGGEQTFSKTVAMTAFPINFGTLTPGSLSTICCNGNISAILTE